MGDGRTIEQGKCLNKYDVMVNGWVLIAYECPHCGNPFSVDMSVVAVNSRLVGCPYCKEPMDIDESVVEAYELYNRPLSANCCDGEGTPEEAGLGPRQGK